MAWTFNPFSGTFDQKGSGGGGSAFFAGEVATYADLPLDGTAALNSRWLVRNSSGTWPFPNYRQGGIYIRTSTVGSSRDNDYTLADTKLPDVFADSAFLLYDNGDSTRNLQFDLGSIATGTTSTLTVPASGTIARTSDIPTTFAASAITSGIIATDRLGTGTANGSTFLAGDQTYKAVSGVTTGSVDNAIIRADGTGGSTSQSSDVIIDDPVVAYAVTGDASTDIITAVGHNFTENQRVRFQSLTGGAGLFFGGPGSSTTYFVRNISGNTFQVSTTSGVSAVNFTTNITAGAVLAVQRNVTLRTRKQAFAITADAATDTITATGHTFVNGDAVSFYNLTGGNNLDEVSRWYVIEAATNTFKVSNSLNGTARDITASYTGGTVELEIPLVLGAPRSSALILGDKPDGTIIGGNVRGFGAVDLQTNRNGQNAIASGTFSFIGNGQNNTASGLRAIVVGGTGNTASATDAVVFGGENNQATSSWASVAGGTNNISSGTTSFSAGSSNTMQSAATGAACGRNALGDRDNAWFQATGRFAVQGDAQTVRASLRGKSSSTTAVELFMGFSGDVRFAIPSGKTMAALITVVAATSGGEFANRYVRAVTIANRGGTTALRGAVKDLDTEEQIGGADVTISANDTNDAIRIEFSGVAPVTGCTAAASTDVITKTSHGFSNNDDIVFTSLTGGAGLTANTVTYWVINANANDFQVSATRGGAAVNITTDYSDMTAARLFRVVASLDGVDVGHGT